MKQVSKVKESDPADTLANTSADKLVNCWPTIRRQHFVSSSERFLKTPHCERIAPEMRTNIKSLKDAGE